MRARRSAEKSPWPACADGLRRATGLPVTLVQAPFSRLREVFDEQGIAVVDGVLADVADPNSVGPAIDDFDTHLHLAGGAGSDGATGGMATKFEAARLATTLGVQTWIAHGRVDGVIQEAINGQAGTQFTI